jgi:hypothetical protein
MILARSSTLIKLPLKNINGVKRISADCANDSDKLRKHFGTGFIPAKQISNFKRRLITMKTNLFKKATTLAGVAGSMAAMTATTALADWGSDSVTVSATSDASTMMGKIIGILLTITRFVGVALIIYGVYEIVMSFMQNQPEAKTKGIVMALAGSVMTALKSILQSIGVIG